VVTEQSTPVGQALPQFPPSKRIPAYVCGGLIRIEGSSATAIPGERGLGGEFFAVVATLSLIETNPRIGTTISADDQIRRVLVSRFPYEIVYRLRPAEIVIVAIAHLKRRPGYWKNRS
jgi:hypothetical protein